MRIEKLGAQGLCEYAWRLVGSARFLYYRFVGEGDDAWRPAAK